MKALLLRGMLWVGLFSLTSTVSSAGVNHENPVGWDQRLRVEAATDVNPDPNIVEVYLTAQETEVEILPGVMTTVWAYNGQVPGPRIEANVGDTLIVHLTNHLPQGTSIHWHGVELPAEMDGSNLAQHAVPPGESFTYEFKVLNAATHWYHPHFRTNEQIDLGLAGPLIFRDPAEDSALQAAGLPKGTELTLVLDDMLLDEMGQPVPFATEELESTKTHRTLRPKDIAGQLINGREGDLLLVNGRQLPTLLVRQGVPQRFRIINVANGRFMRLSLPGHTLYRIGGDGGLLKEAIPIPSIDQVEDPDDPSRLISNPDPEVGLLLAPSERADIVFTPSRQQGQTLYLEWHDFPRGRHRVLTDSAGKVTGFGDDERDGKKLPRKLMRIIVVGKSPHTPALNLPLSISRFESSPLIKIRDLVNVALNRSPPTSALNLSSPLPRSEHSPLIDIRDLVDLSNRGQALPVFFGHGAPQPNGAINFFAAVQKREGLLEAIRAKTAEVALSNGRPVEGKVGPPRFGPRPFSAVNLNAALDVTIGDVRFWEVVNFTGADHPFHSHGFFFQPIETVLVDLGDETAGVPSSVKTVTYPLENKDSIRLPARPGALGRSWTITRLAVRFDDRARAESPLNLMRTHAELAASGKEPGGTGTGFPSLGDSGGWVFHCHINEHADQGMMSFFNLVAP